MTIVSSFIYIASFLQLGHWPVLCLHPGQSRGTM